MDVCNLYVICKNHDRSLAVWLTIFAIIFTYKILSFIIVENFVQNIAVRFIQNMKTMMTYPCTIKTTVNLRMK
jgi:hypothetical protein